MLELEELAREASLTREGIPRLVVGRVESYDAGHDGGLKQANIGRQGVAKLRWLYCYINGSLELSD